MKKITTKRIIEFKKTRLKYPVIKELKSRFSPRFFKEEKIDSKILNSIFEAGRWAPSAYNNQPWCFYWSQKNSFAYKTELSWWILAIAGLSAILIAVLTVSWQSWKAATKNPVEALRYE